MLNLNFFKHVFKLHILVLFMNIYYLSFAQNCPNLSNNNNNPNFSAQVYVYDEDFQLVDSVGCSVAGNSGNFNCEGIDDDQFYVYINDGDTCFFDSGGNNIDNPLPVELIAFNGGNIDQYNVLTWVTASERNSDFFALEYSEDGEYWKEIAVVTAAGSSTLTLSYHFKDFYFKNDNINYYRLIQTDFDGQTELFPPIAIDNRANDKKSYRALQPLGPAS